MLVVREVGRTESDAILGAMRQVALAGGRTITYADTASILAAARYLLRRRDLDGHRHAAGCRSRPISSRAERQAASSRARR